MEVWIVCRKSLVSKYTGIELCPQAVFSTKEIAHKWAKESGGEAYIKNFEVDLEIT